MLTTSQVLERAADKIERDGWYSYGDGLVVGRQPKCVSQAISGAMPAFHSYSGAHKTFAISIGDGTLSSIWRWNDTPGRTKAEVLAMLRAVAATERARETQSQPVGAEVAA